MVLDSADDHDIFFKATDGVPDRRPLATYLPQSRNGCIVVTTRDKHLADRLTGKRDNSIEVGTMREIEALALLKKKLGSASQWNVGMAGALVQALDFVPLAVSQAAAYIQTRAPRSSLEKYLDEFRQSDRKRARL